MGGDVQGFISLHRKLMENPVWSDPYYLKLWMYCLFTASHKKHEQLVGSQIVELERGQFVTGRFSLSEDLNKGMKPKQKLNDRTWWRHLECLEKWQMLTIKSTNKYSLVTIDKYDFYQSVFNKVDQQMSISCPSNDQQMSTNNNVNKCNKKDSCPKRVYDEDSAYVKMSNYFMKKILEWKPNFLFKGNIQTWADDFRKLHELDQRSKDDIKSVIDWCTEDSFWQSNILSPDKLRKQFDTLQGQMNRPVVKNLDEHRKRKEINSFDYQVALQRHIESGGDPSDFVYRA